jgi:hypothetical protein
MRLKFIILIILFLAGLLISLFVYQMSETRVLNSPTPIPTIAAPRSEAPTPYSNPFPQPTSFPTPNATPAPQETISAMVKVQSSINKTLEELPEGQVYHNVPEQMQVGVSEIIETGMAPEVTEKIKKELQGKGIIRTKSGVPYNPSGVEMKLVVKKDEFDVFEIRAGKQLVTPKTPRKWSWEVTPKKSGDNLIIVKAIVELNVPELKDTRSVEVEVFSARRKVDVNFGYSVKEFVSTNWKEVLGLLVGSGSIAGLVTWWIGKNEKKAKES